MRILAVDVGTGTQDIFLFDSSQLLDNCVQMIMPSPTAIIARRISGATKGGKPVLLGGVTMGGGPIKGAIIQHITAGLKTFATEEAALTLCDNLEKVKEMGISVISHDEIPHFPDLEVIELKDLDLMAIYSALDAFTVDRRVDAVAVAVLDHGFSPNMSNRRFRFDYLRQVVSKNRELSAFCYLGQDIPDYLTRMKAVARSIDMDTPLLILDTGVAAVLGMLQDKKVAQHDHLVTVNLGNSHTIAFHMSHGIINGLFEHHSKLLNVPILDSLIISLIRGILTSEEVYEGGGHGALVIEGSRSMPFISITGPRRGLAAGSLLKPHHAAPHGDVMLTGCYGLIKACALKMDSWRDEIERVLK